MHTLLNCKFVSEKNIWFRDIVHSRSKNPVWYIFSISIVDLCNNFFKFEKNIEIFFHFMILAIFLQNKCKIGDLLAIFFFAFFASFSLQRIFIAKIFFFAKNSLHVPSINSWGWISSCYYSCRENNLLGICTPQKCLKK